MICYILSFLDQPKHIPFVLISLLYLLTACSSFDLRPSTPTPASDNPAMERFEESAPAPFKATATQSPHHMTDRVIIPEGLPLPLVDPLTVNGELYVVGSPAMASLMRSIYQRFVTEGYRDIMKVGEVGNELGFQFYCEYGIADMVMATRPMIQDELELCMAHDRMPFALRVGLDAVAIVMHHEEGMDTSFVETVTQAELAKLFTVERWSDIRRHWPDREIIRYIPHPDSGIFKYFASELLEGNSLALRSATETTPLHNEMEIALNISDTPYAVGFINYATYVANPQGMKLLAVDRVQPTVENVVSGDYPLTRSLLLYMTTDILREKPQVNAFLMYYLTNMNDLIMGVGNFPVSEAVFERTKVVLLTAQEQLGYLERFSPTYTPIPTNTPTRFPMSTPTAVITTTVTSP